MADMRNFTRKFVLEFIEIYRSLPCLWKIKSKEYSDRDKKNLAYRKLIDKLREQIPDADRTMVVKKLDSIRGSFRKEWKKINNSKKSGAGTEEVYKPRLWYFNELVFLKDHQLPKTSITRTAESITSEQESTRECSPTPSSTSTKPRSSTLNSNTSLRNTSLKKRNSVLSNIILKKVNDKLDSKGREDYYDIVAKHLASKLRKLPEEVAKVTEKLLFDLVYEAEFGYVDRYTKLQLFQTGVSGQSECSRNNNQAMLDNIGEDGQQNSSNLEYIVSYDGDEDNRRGDSNISNCGVESNKGTKQELL